MKINNRLEPGYILEPIAVVGSPVMSVTIEVNMDNSPANRHAPDIIPPSTKCAEAAIYEQHPTRPTTAKR